MRIGTIPILDAPPPRQSLTIVTYSNTLTYENSRFLEKRNGPFGRWLRLLLVDHGMALPVQAPLPALCHGMDDGDGRHLPCHLLHFLTTQFVPISHEDTHPRFHRKVLLLQDATIQHCTICSIQMPPFFDKLCLATGSDIIRLGICLCTT